MADESMTREQAFKTIADLKAAHATVGEKLATNEKALADLKGAHQALVEDVNRRNMKPEHYDPSDIGLTKYLDPKRECSKIGIVPVSTKLDGVHIPGLLDDTETHGAWHKRFKEIVSNRNLVRQFRKLSFGGDGKIASPACDRILARHLEAAPPVISKIFSDSANAGAEWIPDVWLPKLEETLKLQAKTEALFDVLPMTDKEQRIPFLTTGLRPYKKGAGTTEPVAQYTSSTPYTEKLSITADGMAVRALVDEDASEDDILSTDAIFYKMLAEAIQNGVGDCLINGDTTAAHEDAIATWDTRGLWGTTGLGGTNDHRRCWKGLRRLAVDKSTATDRSATQTYAGLVADMAVMSAPHVVDGDLVMLVSPEYYLAKMMDWDETLTVDAYGPNAAILTGEISRVGLARVVLDWFITADMNNSGLYGNSTKTKSGYVLVNRKRFMMGNRRGVQVETQKNISSGYFDFVATRRCTFFQLDAAATKNCAYAYKLL
jgi:hypothetical protein